MDLFLVAGCSTASAAAGVDSALVVVVALRFGAMFVSKTRSQVCITIDLYRSSALEIYERHVSLKLPHRSWILLYGNLSLQALCNGSWTV